MAAGGQPLYDQAVQPRAKRNGVITIWLLGPPDFAITRTSTFAAAEKGVAL
jgi:hypothetical protein